MDGYSTLGVMAAYVADEDAGLPRTSSQIIITPPPQGQMSSPPVNGTYVITCEDNQGFVYTSDEIQSTYNVDQIERTMMLSMGMMVENINVITDYRFAYPENGISFLIHFYGLDYEVPLCQIVPSGDYPLSGNYDAAANSEVVQIYGESLFFPVIPLEQLHSDAQTPQITVTIDGTPALCLDLNCDFQYIETPASLTA